ncbi:MAG: MATE family efflux transporter [Limnochordia bacterium]|jgi:MATE family multidrug resistance protein
MSKEESYTGGLLQLAVPLILSNLAYTLLGTLDTIFMGRVGITELGAVGVASALFLAVGVFLRGTVGAVMVVVAHSLGAGDKKRARRAFQHAIVLALLLSPLSLLVPKLFRVLFALVKPDKNVRSLALTYVAIRSWELPLGLVSKAISGFMLGAGIPGCPCLSAG